MLATEPGARLLVSVDAAHARLALTGELDLSTVRALREAARALRDVSTTRITIDLRELRFIDAAGLGGLTQLCATLTGADRQVTLSRPSRNIRRTFARAGLTELL